MQSQATTEYTVPVQLEQSVLENTGHLSDEAFGSWTGPEQIKSLTQQFIAHSDSPFPYAIIDDFFSPSTLEKLLQHFPEASSSVWHSYNNPLEIKLSCNNLDKLSEEIRSVFFSLNSPEFVKLISSISGISDLEADPYLHGGGLHCHPPGGKLDIHLDYMVHPLLPNKERRLNLIVYLNKDWIPEYQGELQLWDKTLSYCAAKVPPLLNRGVIFQTSDISYHGLPDPTNSFARQSLANYYISPLREGATPRLKAKFFARPTDTPNEALDKLREIRANRRITEQDLKDVGLA